MLTIIKVLPVYDLSRVGSPIEHQRREDRFKFTFCGKKCMPNIFKEADEVTPLQKQVAAKCRRCETLAEEFEAKQRAEIARLRQWNQSATRKEVERE